jgi:hypothetical protein
MVHDSETGDLSQKTVTNFSVRRHARSEIFKPGKHLAKADEEFFIPLTGNLGSILNLE